MVASVVIAITLLLAAASPAAAQRTSFDFTVEPDPPNVGEVTTFRMTPSSARGVEIKWDLNGNGLYESEGRTVTRTYTAAGPVTVTMRVLDDDEEVRDEVTKTIVVNGPPTVGYTYSPASPVEDEAVAFSATAGDAEGDAVTLSWDFGDGGTATGASPSHPFAARGDYTVTVTARDERGLTATDSQTVTVRPRPEPGPGGDAGQDPDSGAGFDLAPVAPVAPERPAARRLRLMRPLPVVRIAGYVVPNGARVRILSVRAPRGVSVRVRCTGAGCPTGAVARTSATRLLRFRQFERRLNAGIRLELFIRKAGFIGKYTRFKIRAGDPPARVDRCLFPGRARPRRCP